MSGSSAINFDPEEEFNSAINDIFNGKTFDLSLNSQQLGDPFFWESYLLSYGTGIAEFNLGMARAMQGDVSKTNSVCFIKAV